MAKQQKEDLVVEPAVNSKQEAFEIIEVASEELELLARAFNLIADVCAGEDDADEDEERLTVH